MNYHELADLAWEIRFSSRVLENPVGLVGVPIHS